MIGFCPGDEDDDDSDSDDDDDDSKPKAPFVPYFQPVLISPYDVPPKPVRDIYWMDAFTKAKRSKAKLKKLDYLVYVYGSNNPNDCYNFVNQSEFVSYEDGLKQGYCEENQEQQLSNKRLTRGLKEMKMDLQKEPTDRRKDHVDEPFRERYEDDGPPSKKQKT